MGQDSNAANEGDQLKHALLAEVLLRCRDWPSLTYAETHAGAGIYDATSQSAGKAHIHQLKTLVDGLEIGEEANAGGGYAGLLKTWWSESENADKYPGSVLQAALSLKRREGGLEPAHILVTEACEDTHKRLANAVQAFGVEPTHAGFQDEIPWLTESDSLVLLLDPFTYTNDKKALNKGRIDLDTLITVLAACWDKPRCVVGFWCAVCDSTGWEKRRQVDRHILALIRDARAMQKVYCAGRCNRFQMSLIGVGEGSDVVAQLPAAPEWRDSWLKAVIRERES